ncbi:Beta-lactamase domain protein [Desulfosarcina cetonica]|uniref:MBL fold metallo-hydrolase n=1 Tax=Desulfosarcina cetonica TaxID=90730 RepID=UPI0006CF616A|nr:MBL fold metallo-hydrolase [Desulfosarcina cetonica]VTR69782.1 Beta-lactamase domain protein [Desulfosarcina cetonica]
MIIRQMALGPIQANCYILGCEETRQAVVIDPGDDVDRILTTLAGDRLTVVHIINTHGHFDHVGANSRLKAVTGADILIHSDDASMLSQLAASAAAWGMHAENSPPADRLLENGDTITFGTHTLTVLHTPGHTPGGICLYTEYSQGGEIQKAVFAGDTLFAGSIGRTDFPGGSFDVLINSIRTRLFTLDDDVRVYAGHMGNTTIGQEKRTNPFCGMR